MPFRACARNTVGRVGTSISRLPVPEIRQPIAKTPRALHVSQRRPTRGRTRNDGALNAAVARPTVVAEPPRWSTQRAMIGLMGVWLAYERKPPVQTWMKGRVHKRASSSFFAGDAPLSD